jgi:aerobic carbon-monoxide dehydrogenase medium subunit
VSGLRPFGLHRAESVGEASRLMAERAGDAVLYAGGTELLLLLKLGFIRPRWLIDVKRVPSLRGIGYRDGDLVIGATVPHREVERSPEVRARCPLVAGMARHVANVRVRAVGTVGGNLAFADPHSDLATLFLVFDARVTLESGAGSRELALADFVRGPYETARRDEELVTSVRLRPWAAGAAGAYVKFGLHERPTLGVAVALLPNGVPGRVGEARVAVGCVGPRPERFARVENAIRGRDMEEIGRRAGELGALAAEETDPADDLHGSAEYKRDMTRVFVGRALALAAARAQGQAPDVRYAHTVVV